MLLALFLIAAPEAIIVTHNGGATLDRPDLRYADDDGLQYAALFRQANMKVTLLTAFDSDTRLLHPGAVADGTPTHSELYAAVASAKSASDVYLVFAGHGDVRDGHGFLSLADGPLSSAELEERVIAPLDHTRVHLLIDSCNSYFMITPRKPGGTAFQTTAPQSLLARHARLNVLLSTSAEAVTYEWSEIQSGIFSYLVRSGLRGAADANQDGSVSYAEMAAFVRVATRSIPNDAYRPHVFSRGSSVELFAIPKESSNELIVDGPHRLTLRSPKGIRVADVNTEGPVRLWLPPERITVEERKGQRLVQHEIGPAQRLSLSQLPDLPRTIAERGESPVFSNLFEQPFGPHAASQPVEEEAFGVSKAEVERWRTLLSERARSERDRRNANAWALGIGSAALIGGGVPGIVVGLTTPGGQVFSGAVLAASGVLTAAIGLPVLLARKTPSEKLFEELSALTLDTETARSLAITRMAEHLFRLHNGQRTAQIIWGTLAASAGVSLGAIAAVNFALLYDPTANAQTRQDVTFARLSTGTTYAALGTAMIGVGLYQLITLPKKIRSIDELQLNTAERPLEFTGFSIGGDGKGAYGTLSLSFQ